MIILKASAEDWVKELGISKVRLYFGIFRKQAYAFYRAMGYNDENGQIRFIKSLGDICGIRVLLNCSD